MLILGTFRRFSSFRRHAPMVIFFVDKRACPTLPVFQGSSRQTPSRNHTTRTSGRAHGSSGCGCGAKQRMSTKIISCRRKLIFVDMNFRRHRLMRDGRDPERTRIKCAGSIAPRENGCAHSGKLSGGVGRRNTGESAMSTKIIKKSSFRRHGRFLKNWPYYIENASIRLLILSVRASENIVPTKI